MTGNAIDYSDDGYPELTEKAIDALAVAIATAWLANAEYVYPEGAEYPDPGRSAEVAAKASGALFLEWMMNSLAKEQNKDIEKAFDEAFKDLPEQPE